MACGPAVVGVDAAEQLAELPVPLSVQLAKAVVAASAKKLTVPVGVVAVAPTTTSVTLPDALPIVVPDVAVAGALFVIPRSASRRAVAVAVALEEPSCVASPP